MSKSSKALDKRHDRRLAHQKLREHVLEIAEELESGKVSIKKGHKPVFDDGTIGP